GQKPQVPGLVVQVEQHGDNHAEDQGCIHARKEDEPRLDPAGVDQHSRVFFARKGWVVPGTWEGTKNDASLTAFLLLLKPARATTTTTQNPFVSLVEEEGHGSFFFAPRRFVYRQIIALLFKKNMASPPPRHEHDLVRRVADIQ